MVGITPIDVSEGRACGGQHPGNQVDGELMTPGESDRRRSEDPDFDLEAQVSVVELSVASRGSPHSSPVP